jgi:multidrug efflux pump subunit AcrA (membrane-fusion protein)
MRHLASVVTLAATAALLAAPATAYAQYGGRGGSYGQDASLTIPHIAPSVAALAMRYGGDLQLSQAQLDSISSVRLRQDSANAPWLRTLDSLRNGPRPANPRDLSQEQRELLVARRAAVKAAVEALDATNAQARQQVMAVLTPDQQGKAAQLENAALKLARAQTQRRADEGYYRRGRGSMNEHREPAPEN